MKWGSDMCAMEWKPVVRTKDALHVEDTEICNNA